MNGSEHYLEAARLMEYVEDGALQDGVHLDVAATAEITARAQVHATLALAASNVIPALLAMCGDSHRITDWGNAIGWDTAKAAEPTPPAPLCSHPDCYLTDGHTGDHEEGFPF